MIRTAVPPAWRAGGIVVICSRRQAPASEGSDELEQCLTFHAGSARGRTGPVAIAHAQPALTGKSASWRLLTLGRRLRHQILSRRSDRQRLLGRMSPLSLDCSVTKSDGRTSAVARPSSPDVGEVGPNGSPWSVAEVPTSRVVALLPSYSSGSWPRPARRRYPRWPLSCPPAGSTVARAACTAFSIEAWGPGDLGAAFRRVAGATANGSGDNSSCARSRRGRAGP